MVVPAPETEHQTAIEAEKQLQILKAEIALIPRVNERITIGAASLILIGFFYAIYSEISLASDIYNLRNSISQMEEHYLILAKRRNNSEFIAVNEGVGWLEFGMQADWGGRDLAYSRGITPRFSVEDTSLCDQGRIGAVAVCWQDRRSGYPPGVPSDFRGIAPTWCTYKNDSIQLNTPPDGGAPGIVFVCSRTRGAQ